MLLMRTCGGAARGCGWKGRVCGWQGVGGRLSGRTAWAPRRRWRRAAAHQIVPPLAGGGVRVNWAGVGLCARVGMPPSGGRENRRPRSTRTIRGPPRAPPAAPPRTVPRAPTAPSPAFRHGLLKQAPPSNTLLIKKMSSTLPVSTCIVGPREIHDCHNLNCPPLQTTKPKMRTRTPTDHACSTCARPTTRQPDTPARTHASSRPSFSRWFRSSCAPACWRRRSTPSAVSELVSVRRLKQNSGQTQGYKHEHSIFIGTEQGHRTVTVRW